MEKRLWGKWTQIFSCNSQVLIVFFLSAACNKDWKRNHMTGCEMHSDTQEISKMMWWILAEMEFSVDSAISSYHFLWCGRHFSSLNFRRITLPQMTHTDAKGTDFPGTMRATHTSRAQAISDECYKGKGQGAFSYGFLRSGSCTFLAFTFGNWFSFKYAHLSSSLSSFHASALILPALPGKQTIFPLQLLGNMR